MRKKVKKKTQVYPTTSTLKIPIRVLYKKVGQEPVVKIISNVYKLKQAIVKRNLDIIPYEKLFIICNNNKAYNMRPNIYFPLRCITGDFIVVNIDRKKREFKSLSQEEIIWYTEDLINKSPPNATTHFKTNNFKKFTNVYERGFEDNRHYTSTNFEKTLINVLVNLELVLANILKDNNNGGIKNG